MCIRDSHKDVQQKENMLAQQFKRLASVNFLVDDFADDGKLSLKKIREMEAATQRKAQEVEEDKPRGPEYIHAAFYNEKAANIKADIKYMEDSLKEWQKDFKTKNAKKPSLEEMKNDPEMKKMLDNIKAQRRQMKVAINRYQINQLANQRHYIYIQLIQTLTHPSHIAYIYI
eukprot:TRINITY_DN7348_c0_g1_i2.p1 TRINITY_DN7348_c0_g1~~TRINITY_DN7348_c0_g1_i2.p1  ORF type:complete len:172 (+),score=45.16 TRINITY_DN7348_c0_g1_i2:66-581(+)